MLATQVLPAILAASLLWSKSDSTEASDAVDPVRAKEGKAVAFERKLGNCLACHQIDDGASPGNIGPPLLAMRSRFSDRQELRDQIWDPTRNNPETRMPPFGRHKILTEDQIDKIVDYLLTL